MRISRIYTDFDPEIGWIRREVQGDVQSLDPSVRSLARFYTEARLEILQGREVEWLVESGMGRMVPYVTFWFADALGLAKSHVRRLAGLALVISAIVTALVDDTADTTSANKAGIERLRRFWSERYYETLRKVFPEEGEFRRTVSSAEDECRRYERWQSTPSAAANPHPFSAGFLRESSRSTVACILPPLVAVAHAAGRKEDVPRIEKFLWEYTMGWRIFDDLMDWEEDLAVKEMNRSSVLMYVANKMGQAPVDRLDVLSWFMSNRFAKDAYGAIIGHMSKAREIVASFDNTYLHEFMESEVRFQTHKRDSLIRGGNLALSDLSDGVAAVLGQTGPSAPRRGFRRQR